MLSRTARPSASSTSPDSPRSIYQPRTTPRSTKLVEEVTEQVEEDTATAAKSRWSRLEAIVGADARLDMVAADIVDHWEKRRESILGKA